MSEGQRDNSCRVILIVDDQNDNLEVLNAFISSLGHIVVEARNGVEAVRAALEASPDLIIMDLSMPVMDGFLAVRILREMSKTSRVPVVAWTALDSESHKLQALHVGFNEFLTKPINFLQLNGVLNQFLKAA